jgi:DNA-binding GntR family transcriptional regulator
VAPEVERPIPAYMQISDLIRAQIQSGELKDGDAVPSARQISQDWKVALATATKVLAALQSEGLVRSLPGIGTVVTVTNAVKDAPRDRMELARKTGRIYRANERAEIVAAELIQPPDQVASALGLEPGETAIRRQRITYRDDQPVSASTSWFAGSLAGAAPLLLRTERLLQGTPGYIEEVTGRRMVKGRDQLSASVATPEEAASLSIPAGASVRRGRNWLYDAAGEVVEYGESIAIADRWTTYDYSLQPA